MKTPFSFAWFCLAAALCCGCSSRHVGAIYHAGDENPPDFLIGPITVVLTNLNGFSAHVAATTTSSGEMTVTSSGVILGRDGRLVYQPSLPVKGKRAEREGGLFFIWDDTKDSGYVMSEALQGYAPIKSDIAAAGDLSIEREAIQQDINGHPCHRASAAVALNNGANVHLTLWQADDLGRFPVRIEQIDGLKQRTLDFSDIRVEYPPQEIFLPPDGFTPYASSVALMNELIVRDTSLARKHQFGADEDAPPDQSGNWHTMPTVPNQ